MVEYKSFNDVESVKLLIDKCDLMPRAEVRYDPVIGLTISQGKTVASIPMNSIILQLFNNAIYVLYHDKGIILN